MDAVLEREMVGDEKYSSYNLGKFPPVERNVRFPHSWCEYDDSEFYWLCRMSDAAERSRGRWSVAREEDRKKGCRHPEWWLEA